MNTLRWLPSRAAIAALVLSAFPSVADAQVFSYDAGTVNYPSSAPDPQSQGWSLASSSTAQTQWIPGSSPGDLNAWEIAEAPSCVLGGVSYSQLLFSSTWLGELSLEAHIMESDSTYGASMSLTTGNTSSDDAWRVGFQVVGSDVVATQQAFGGMVHTIVCPDGALGFHRYAIRRSPILFHAEFVYDGVVLGVIESGMPHHSSEAFCGFGVQGCPSRMRVHQFDLMTGSSISVGSPCAGLASNSTGAAGRLMALGSADATGPGFTLVASQLPPNSLGYFLLSLGTGSVALPNSQGQLCLDPTSISRAWGPNGPLYSGQYGQYSLRLDPLNMPTNPPGPIAGATLYFQAWHLDVNPMPTSNVSEAVAVTIQ